MDRTLNYNYESFCSLVLTLQQKLANQMSRGENEEKIFGETDNFLNFDVQATDVRDAPIDVSGDEADKPSALDTTNETEHEIDCETIPTNLYLTST